MAGAVRAHYGGKFSGTLLRYPGAGGWVFVPVPERLAPPVTHGWGGTLVFSSL